MATSQPVRFKLCGPMGKYDPRTTPIRGDLADVKLAGRLFAPHYVVPQVRSCTAITASISAQPKHEAIAVSQLLHGEKFAVLDISGDWAWGYGAHDDYLGYVLLEALGEESEVSHAITARGALVFAEPDIKSPVLVRLPMGAKIHGRVMAGEDANASFLHTGKGYIHVRHAEKIGMVRKDRVTLARMLTGAPYLWGGRSGDGLDCSGLVQMVLGLAGIAAPRDSDQQMAALGSDIADGEALQGGDIIFFPGHVGIIADADNLIHANAYWMQVVEEPLADVIGRFGDEAEKPVLARKRLAL